MVCSGTNSNHNIIVLDTTDYINFYVETDSHSDDYSTITWNPSKQYTSISSSFITDFNNQGVTDIQLEQTDIGTYRFTNTAGAFDITGMSYNVKQALGFYYVNDGETIKCTSKVTTSSSSSSDSETSLLANSSITYYIEAKAMGYSNFTPVWFLISNLGQPNQITTNNDKWKPLFPAIVMNIQNTFSAETYLTWSNSDYVSESPTSALNNLKVKVVDGNLEPIKFLNPVYITIIVQGIPDDEKLENNEVFDQAEMSKEVRQMISSTLNKYRANREINNQKVEAGITVEPQTGAFPEKQETKPEEIKLAQEMVIEQTHE